VLKIDETPFNYSRTVKLNVHEADTLEFNMDTDKKNKLVKYSYNETAKYLLTQMVVNAAHIINTSEESEVDDLMRSYKVYGN
jgi:hypothetical protein